MADHNGGGGGGVEEKIAYFQAVTGVDDLDLCTEILSAHNWDLDLAISTFTSPASAPVPAPAASSNPNPNSNPPANRSTDPNPNPPGLAWKLITLPFYAVSGGIGLISGAVGLGFWVAGGVLSRSLNLLGLLPPNSATPSSTEATGFIASFDRDYGGAENYRRPDFAEEGIMEALQRSRREFKLMFVYFHSPDHPDVPEFCLRCLCSEVVVEFLNENFVVWGGSIRGTEGFQMSNSLNVSRFPFCAVVMPASNLQIRLLARVISLFV